MLLHCPCLYFQTPQGLPTTWLSAEDTPRRCGRANPLHLDPEPAGRIWPYAPRSSRGARRRRDVTLVGGAQLGDVSHSALLLWKSLQLASRLPKPPDLGCCIDI